MSHTYLTREAAVRAWNEMYETPDEGVLIVLQEGVCYWYASMGSPAAHEVLATMTWRGQPVVSYEVLSPSQVAAIVKGA